MQGQKKVIQGLPTATHLASNETLLLYQGYVGMESYSFNRDSGISAIWVNWAQITPTDVLGHKNNLKSSAPHFTSSEALLFCQDHLRIQLYLLYGYLGIKEIWGSLNVNYKVPRIIEKAQQMVGIIWSFQNIFFLITMFSYDNYSDGLVSYFL